MYQCMYVYLNNGILNFVLVVFCKVHSLIFSLMIALLCISCFCQGKIIV